MLDVHIADYPIVLLIDDGDAAALPIIKRAAARFVARVGERPVVVGTLSNPDAIRATFEDDRQDVLDQIESIVPGASDAGLTLAATARGAQLLQDTGSPFSAIVAVSARAIDATQTVRGDLLPIILGSGATVHVVAGRPSAQDGAVPADVPDLLRVLADQSHGHVHGDLLDRVLCDRARPARGSAGDGDDGAVPGAGGLAGGRRARWRPSPGLESRGAGRIEVTSSGCGLRPGSACPESAARCLPSTDCAG